MPFLEFGGKQFVWAHHLGVPFCGLEVVARRSVLPRGAAAADGNLIVHGDNLHALKALVPRYGGRVNCVYIDPPYNTGNEGWVYNDNVNSPLMQRWLKESGAVDREDGERHDKWLSMMWPRLHLLRDLLADDGVIFVSIDDNEQHRLRLIMDEIFGEDNFVANIVWQKKYAPANDAKHFSDNHDFIVCFAKNKANGDNGVSCWRRNLLSRTEKQDALYKYDDGDGRGSWRTDNLTVKSYDQKYDYPIVNPVTKKKYHPAQGTCWRTSKENLKKWIAENRVFFGKNGKGAPQLKRYLAEVQEGIVPLTIWLHEEVGHTDGARKVLKEIFHDKDRPFDNPKPVGLIKRIIQIAAEKDAVILDSFAGSGTTGQAVLELNKEDGGNRRFILIECEDYADKITAERVRRVIRGVPQAKSENLRRGLGGHFSFCKLGKPINAEKLLRGEDLPAYETLARYAAYTATGQPAHKIKKGKDGLFAETDRYRMHMLYQPSLKFLRSSESALTFEIAERVAKAAKTAGGKETLFFATHKFMSQKDLTILGVTFCQLPWAVFRIFGNQSFADDDET